MARPLSRLALTDFRSYRDVDLALHPGRVAFIGRNGVGKTNLVEAIGWLATGASFRQVANAALVAEHAERAHLLAEFAGDHPLTLAATIPRRGAAHVQANGKRLARLRDLLGHVRVTVFSPDDLDLVKGAPAGRRLFVDELLVQLDRRMEKVQADLERVLRHRGTLLRDAGGRLDADAQHTLDVWDSKLAPLATELGRARVELVTQLDRYLKESYYRIAESSAVASMRYEPEWLDDFAELLAERRREDVRRGVSTVGPHRDEIAVAIDRQPARTHRSQGEQRTLSVSLRLAGHQLVHDAVGEAPLLLLDDVFSELDRGRTRALIAHLPTAQAFITSAVELPAEAAIDQYFDVSIGTCRERA